MTERRLPAYAKRLLNARRMGQHPLCVHFILGHHWRQPVECGWAQISHPDHPICLKPGDYAPGEYDFRALTGMRVLLVDEAGGAGEYRHGSYPAMTEHGPFYDLVGELCRYAAWVEIMGQCAADDAAFLSRDYRYRNDAARNYGWPRWWSEEIEKQHGERYQTWIQCVGEEVDSRLTAAEA